MSNRKTLVFLILVILMIGWIEYNLMFSKKVPAQPKIEEEFSMKDIVPEFEVAKDIIVETSGEVQRSFPKNLIKKADIKTILEAYLHKRGDERVQYTFTYVSNTKDIKDAKNNTEIYFKNLFGEKFFVQDKNQEKNKGTVFYGTNEMMDTGVQMDLYLWVYLNDVNEVVISVTMVYI